MLSETIKLRLAERFAAPLPADDLTGVYLIYDPLTYEKDRQDDWLLDIKLYSEDFRADLVSLQMEELLVEPSSAMRKTVKLYAKFLDNKDRKAKLKRIGNIYRHRCSVEGTGFDTCAGITLDDWASMLSALTGWDMDGKELFKVGERVCNLQRLFNMREGLGRNDDKLPKRVLSVPEFGKYADHPECVIQDFEGLLDEYYEAHNWNKDTGYPQKEKLRELGLEEYTTYFKL